MYCYPCTLKKYWIYYYIGCWYRFISIKMMALSDAKGEKDKMVVVLTV